jgi:methionine aminopeptidase
MENDELNTARVQVMSIACRLVKKAFKTVRQIKQASKDSWEADNEVRRSILNNKKGKRPWAIQVTATCSRCPPA